jgi:Protein of unknown function (DUF3309)
VFFHVGFFRFPGDFCRPSNLEAADDSDPQCDSRTFELLRPVSGSGPVRNALLPEHAALPQGRSMGLLLILLLVFLVVGGLPRWGYSQNWGYGPSGLLSLILIVLLILILFTDVIHISRW